MVADDQVEEQVVQGGITPARMALQPTVNQTGGQRLMPSASGPAGCGPDSVQKMTRHVRLGHKDAAVVGIEPALKTPVGLADVVQPT